MDLYWSVLRSQIALILALETSIVHRSLAHLVFLLLCSALVSEEKFHSLANDTLDTLQEKIEVSFTYHVGLSLFYFFNSTKA